MDNLPGYQQKLFKDKDKKTSKCAACGKPVLSKYEYCYNCQSQRLGWVVDYFRV